MRWEAPIIGVEGAGVWEEFAWQHLQTTCFATKETKTIACSTIGLTVSIRQLKMRNCSLRAWGTDDGDASLHAVFSTWERAFVIKLRDILWNNSHLTCILSHLILIDTTIPCTLDKSSSKCVNSFTPSKLLSPLIHQMQCYPHSPSLQAKAPKLHSVKQILAFFLPVAHYHWNNESIYLSNELWYS